MPEGTGSVAIAALFRTMRRATGMERVIRPAPMAQPQRKLKCSMTQPRPRAPRAVAASKAKKRAPTAAPVRSGGVVAKMFMISRVWTMP